ncbi:hypothetical protein C8R43DRAFT_950504 [Mycena crocata]|nr:hypothetical protein C8R43DRAFT_950504 [Mycena crocata]
MSTKKCGTIHTHSCSNMHPDRAIKDARVSMISFASSRKRIRGKNGRAASGSCHLSPEELTSRSIAVGIRPRNPFHVYFGGHRVTAVARRLSDELQCSTLAEVPQGLKAHPDAFAVADVESIAVRFEFSQTPRCRDETVAVRLYVLEQEKDPRNDRAIADRTSAETIKSRRTSQALQPYRALPNAPRRLCNDLTQQIRDQFYCYYYCSKQEKLPVFTRIEKVSDRQEHPQ